MQPSLDELGPRPALRTLALTADRRLGATHVRRVGKGRAFVLRRGSLRCLPPSHENLVHDHARDQRDGPNRVVVARDRDRQHVRIGIRIRNRHHRDTQALRLANGDVFLVRVDYEDKTGKPGHVLDTRQVTFELPALPIEEQALLLRVELERALFRSALEILEPPDVLLHRLEVREHSAKPALGNVERARALGLGSHRALELRLGADEENVASASHHFVHEITCPIQLPEGLLQVDQVNAAPLGEDVLTHLRVPAVRLVAEVYSCL